MNEFPITITKLCIEVVIKSCEKLNSKQVKLSISPIYKLFLLKKKPILARNFFLLINLNNA